MRILYLVLVMMACHSQRQTGTKGSRELPPYGDGDVVYHAYLDRLGNMWFATSQEGVYKYDGQSFTNYNKDGGLCGNEVSQVMEDRDGDLWFGTENGLCRFDGQDFEAIPLPKYPKKSDWLDRYYPMLNPNAVSYFLQDRRGDIWVGSNCAGLYRYDGTQFTSFLQERGKLMPDSMHHNSISAIVEDRQGQVWVGSFSHGGISQFDGAGFVHHALPDGIGEGMISSIYIDHQERMWVGTRNNGIYRYDGSSFQPFTDPASVEKIPMAKFFQDSRGTLWMSSYARKGVYRFDGASFRPFEVEQSEQLVDVMCISEDREGHIWFGGRYGLLWRWDGRVLMDFTDSKRGE